MIRYSVILILSLLLTALCSTGQASATGNHDTGEKGYILLITSYSHDSRNISEFTDDFESVALKMNLDIDSEIEGLGVMSLSDCYNWHSKMKSILRRQNYDLLKGILILGQEAWATYLSLDTIPDVPFYGCYISDTGIPIPGDSIDITAWKPEIISTRQLSESRHCEGAVMFDFDVAGNIELALSMCPKTKTIAFITDNSYGGLSMLSKFRSTMSRDFPNIRTVELDGRKYTTAQIQDKIDSLPPNSIILMGSWRVGNKGTFFLDKVISQIVGNRKDLPMFSVTGKFMKTMAVAGKVPSYRNNYQEFIRNVFLKLAENDHTPQFTILENHYEVNYKNVNLLGINKKSIPQGAIQISDIDEKLARSQKITMGLSIMICAMLAIIMIGIHLWIKTRKQNAQLEEQKKALVISEERAWKSDQLKSRFLANLSHEVHTPANGLIGFLQVLEQKIPNFENEYSKEIKESTFQLLDVISKIVEYSKLDTGTLELNIEQFNICDTMRQTLSRFETQCKNKNLELTASMPLHECDITWDKSLALRILSILVGNAIKFTHKGSVGIGFYPTRKGVTLYVSDTGIGICETNQKRIFERFEKIDEFTEGTGLGLAFIKEITQNAGGKVTLVSKPDIGSRFIVEIPCDVNTPIDNIDQYDISEEIYDANTLLKSQLDNTFKILVAEDSDINFTILKQMMGNHNLTRVTNGKEAVNRMKTDWYDFVLMDIRMPLMDGLQATREIRRFDKDTPIIAITAFTYDSDSIKAKTAGCNELLYKPITRKELYNSILKLM